ncbi:hypothetical protein C7S18_18920 [Ahniella affigens]|uniref:Lipoprotein n=1 Tax=Ahniella affigens TaxID=2021234 RepID=A0A2P1PWF3_9GAMM|nr:hypothetical protein [Ahniella affigens]AVP99114.1 hypothetical protein C7S18_18920 [Ahniella affigens]
MRKVLLVALSAVVIACSDEIQPSPWGETPEARLVGPLSDSVMYRYWFELGVVSNEPHWEIKAVLRPTETERLYLGFLVSSSLSDCWPKGSEARYKVSLVSRSGETMSVAEFDAKDLSKRTDFTPNWGKEKEKGATKFAYYFLDQDSRTVWALKDGEVYLVTIKSLRTETCTFKTLPTVVAMRPGWKQVTMALPHSDL